MSFVHFSFDLLCLLICMCETFLRLSLVSLFYQPVVQIRSSIFIKKKKANTGVSLKDFWGNLIDILFTLVVLCVCGSGDRTRGFVHTKVHTEPHTPSHYMLLNATSTVLNLLPYHLNCCSEGRWCISQQKKEQRKSIHSFICFKYSWLYPKFPKCGTLEKYTCIHKDAINISHFHVLFFTCSYMSPFFNARYTVKYTLEHVSRYQAIFFEVLSTLTDHLSWAPSILYIQSLLEYQPSFSIIQIRTSYIGRRIYKLWICGKYVKTGLSWSFITLLHRILGWGKT